MGNDDCVVTGGLIPSSDGTMAPLIAWEHTLRAIGVTDTGDSSELFVGHWQTLGMKLVLGVSDDFDLDPLDGWEITITGNLFTVTSPDGLAVEAGVDKCPPGWLDALHAKRWCGLLTGSGLMTRHGMSNASINSAADSGMLLAGGARFAG